MQARQIMTRTVECISPDSRIEDAAKRMKSLDTGFLPVCEHDKLVGTLTDRDIVLRAVAEGKDITELKASDIMTDEVFWCYEDQTTEEVGDYMAEKEVRRVLVLNRDKRLVGVVSIGDLAKSGAEHKAGEAMKNIADAPSQAA